MEQGKCEWAKVHAYFSQGQFSRSQPSILCFTQVKKKKSAQQQLENNWASSSGQNTAAVWAAQSKSCILWELQPSVKDSSAEQQILKSGLALPSVDSLAFSLSLPPTATPGEPVSSSQRKDAFGERQDNPSSAAEAQHRNREEPVGAAPGAASEWRDASRLLDFNRHCGDHVVRQRQAGQPVQRQEQVSNCGLVTREHARKGSDEKSQRSIQLVHCIWKVKYVYQHHSSAPLYILPIKGALYYRISTYKWIIE